MEYFPEEQVMQEDAMVRSLAYFPASQLRQSSMLSCKVVEEASSVMYRPVGQLVHEEEPAEEYFPEEQVSHDVLSWEREVKG